MTLTYIDQEDATTICSLIRNSFGLDIDEFESVDDDTFLQLSTKVEESVSEDAFIAFQRCFESDVNEHYFRVSGESDFLSMLDSEYNKE